MGFFDTALRTPATAGAVSAQRPSNESICDRYTMTLLKQSTARNQYTFLTLLVDTVFICNYTQPNIVVSARKS